MAEAFSAALDRCGLARTQIDALATPGDNSERSIIALAETLGLPLIFVAAPEMQKAADSAIAVSDRVVMLKSVLTVAETAALAAAGRAARLLAPRVATPTVTCAIAVGEGASI
jgi:cobalt-precorrin 5A hydrolase